MPLEKIRKRIDVIDRQIIGLLAERLKLTKLVMQIKKREGLKMYDGVREGLVIRRATALGAKKGLDKSAVKRIFRGMVVYMRKNEIKESKK